ncbi:hypothetical protein M5689_016047 [Euphorbia peplus]|nr:hypothetical protein M5689_016047 [Euphorbia peplus]
MGIPKNLQFLKQNLGSTSALGGRMKETEADGTIEGLEIVEERKRRRSEEAAEKSTTDMETDPKNGRPTDLNSKVCQQK